MNKQGPNPQGVHSPVEAVAGEQIITRHVKYDRGKEKLNYPSDTEVGT